jgi:hypothetical protein
MLRYTEKGNTDQSHKITVNDIHIRKLVLFIVQIRIVGLDRVFR